MAAGIVVFSYPLLTVRIFFVLLWAHEGRSYCFDVNGGLLIEVVAKGLPNSFQRTPQNWPPEQYCDRSNS